VNPPTAMFDWWGGPLLTAWFILLLAVERRRPLRRSVDDWIRRLRVNGLIAVPSLLVMRLALIPVVVAVAAWGEVHGVGLVRWLHLPSVAGGLVAILILDYTMYGWHRLNHFVPLFWRFHHVHHADLDLSVATAMRFHFGEMILSVGARSIQVLAAGASPMVALIYEVLLEASTQFHHSNVRLPARVERKLAWFIMTPSAHGIHHSVEGGEMNSNYSNFLILWDRMHGTLHGDVPAGKLVLGVPDCRDPKQLTAVRLLTLPFRRRPAQPARN